MDRGGLCVHTHTHVTLVLVYELITLPLDTFGVLQVSWGVVVSEVDSLVEAHVAACPSVVHPVATTYQRGLETGSVQARKH